MDSIKVFRAGIVTNDWQLLPIAKVVHCWFAAIQHLPGNTVRAKKSDLNFYLAYLGRTERLDRIFLCDYTVEAVAGFLANRLQFETAVTVNRRLASLRTFDSWLCSRIPDIGAPSHRVKGPQAERGAWEGLTETTALALRAAAYTVGESPEMKLRNGLTAELLLSTGLRIDEVLSLKAKQISSCGQWLRQVVCKGQRVRDVYLPQHLDAPLAAWLTARDYLLRKHKIRGKESGEYPLLVSTYTAVKSKPATFKVSYKTFWRVLKVACRTAGIERINPHKLRHSFALLLLDKTHDIRFVAQALGHADVKTTMRYTERSQKQVGELIETAMESANDRDTQESFREGLSAAANKDAGGSERTARKAAREVGK